jgi:hypothetical protein
MEEWRPIPGYEGLYDVSSMGRVRSHPRVCRKLEGKVVKDYIFPSRILKQTKNGKGYLHVTLTSKPYERRLSGVHRLVAKAFIPNPDNLPQINHKDENKTNNSVSNLEWCDNRYNSYYGTKDVKMCKRVCQYGKDGAYIATFRSAHQAAEAIGLSVSSISAAALGKLKTAGGFVWQYL